MMTSYMYDSLVSQFPLPELTNVFAQARLLSLTPLPIQNSLAMIHPSRIPDKNKRGRTFEAAIERLAEWWYSSFFEVLYGGHIRSLTYEWVRERMRRKGWDVPDFSSSNDAEEKGKGGKSEVEKLSAKRLGKQKASSSSSSAPELDTDPESLASLLCATAEPIRSPNSLMKHVLMRSGSRDVSAQLFTALCRALGIPARLVVSVQSVPWQANLEKPKPKYGKRKKLKVEKGGKVKVEDEDEDMEMEEVNIPSPASIPTPGLSTPGLKTELDITLNSSTPSPGPSSASKKSAKAKGKERAPLPTSSDFAIPGVKLRKPRKPKPKPQPEQSGDDEDEDEELLKMDRFLSLGMALAIYLFALAHKFFLLYRSNRYTSRLLDRSVLPSGCSLDMCGPSAQHREQTQNLRPIFL
jgi:xeroderma pigmentosum group C-complementing protein